MKTKSILAAALLIAASAASASAQTVYSVNAVGFVNVVFPPGFTLASNPLEGATNTVAVLFSSVPNGTSVFKFDSALGQYTGTTFLFGNWGNPSFSLVPGEGFFFKNPGSTTITNTFVGNVKQGALTTSLSSGFTLVGSQVPQAGLVSTDLGLLMPSPFLSLMRRLNNIQGQRSSSAIGVVLVSLQWAWERASL